MLRRAPALALVGGAATLIAAGATPAIALQPGTHVVQVAAAPAVQPVEDPLPPPPLSDVQVGVELLTEGLGKPTNSAVAPGDPEALYVSDQTGGLWRVDVRDGSKQKIADLSGLLVPVGLNVEGQQPPRRARVPGARLLARLRAQRAALHLHLGARGQRRADLPLHAARG